MKILLIDIDSKIPNIALMKLSSYYKKQENSVDLITLNSSYYPNRKKRKIVDVEGYDKVFASTIFFDNYKYVDILNGNVEYGGTGYSITKKLPPEIEKRSPDYSIYPDNDISYGFITRGCIRKCSFCVVPEKEGKIYQENKIEDIVKHKKVKFLDNNILSFNNHYEILQELIDKKIRCQFNQGLDIRLLNNRNAELLNKMNYMGGYIFAFDNIKDEKLINKKVELFKKYVNKDWKLKFFLYCHPEMDLKEDVYYRIMWCKKNKLLPYLMRDISCWNNENNHLYIDLASWANQPRCFKKLTFSEYLHKRTSPDRMKKDLILLKKKNKYLDSKNKAKIHT